MRRPPPAVDGRCGMGGPCGSHVCSFDGCFALHAETARRRPVGRVRRLALLCAALVTIVSLAGADRAAAAAPQVPSSFFGISAPDLWSLSLQGKDQASQRDSQLAGMRAAGFDWVRTELGWRDIEPNAPVQGAHTYDWSVGDEHVAALAAHGLSLRPMLMATPTWAAADPAASANGCQRGSAVDPSHARDFAAYAGAVVRRYGPGGSFWQSRPDLPYEPMQDVEIWNEPNFHRFWCPAPDPETFSSMMLQATDAIHGVDPSIDVTLGGLAALQQTQSTGIAADEFLRRMLASSPTLASGIDAVGFHPYAPGPTADLWLIGWFRQSMNAVGLGQAQIALTEFGWHGGTSPGSLPEDRRAANYQQFTDQVARTDCGINAIAAHDWVSPQLKQAYPDDWYGITDPGTGTLYPSGQAYVDEAALLEGNGSTPPPSATIPVCSPPPSVTITSQPDATVRVTSKRLAFASSEPGTFRCDLDESGWDPCSSATSYADLKDGPHTFRVKAIDLAGKISSPSSYSWTVDTTPPSATITSRPAATVGTGSASFAFTSNEPSAFRCNPDRAGWRPCSSPTHYTGLGDGSHTFQVRAADRAGNIGAPSIYRWTIDTTRPEVTITSPRAPVWALDSARFAFTSNEPSAFGCNLDGSGWHPCSSPTSYADLKDGPHTFQVRAADRAGNIDASSTYRWTVDTTPPSATITSRPAATVRTGSARFAFTSNEPSAFGCNLDRSGWRPCGSPIQYTGLRGGSHTFQVRAADRAGNIGQPVTYRR